MGLTLHFELRLPAAAPRDEVFRLLSALREFAASQPVASVSPVFDLSVESEVAIAEDPAAWLRFWAECVTTPIPDDEFSSSTGDPASAIGFFVDPGEGSETATFGLLRRRAESADHEEWFWWCACKTQYASLVSEEHFVAVHTSLAAVLDEAVKLGFNVTVHDETGYWESRSTQRLIDSVRGMNRIVARVAGALSDRTGSADELRAPIFEHRDFEHLEMEDPGHT
jgi:hypothetical protein